MKNNLHHLRGRKKISVFSVVKGNSGKAYMNLRYLREKSNLRQFSQRKKISVFSVVKGNSGKTYMNLRYLRENN